MVVRNHCWVSLVKLSWARNGTVRSMLARGGQVAILHCFVYNQRGSGASWLLKVGCYVADGVELESCLAASKESAVCLVRLRRRVRAWCLVEVKRCGSWIVRWRRRRRRKRRLWVARREKKCARCLVNCHPWALSLRWWEMKGQYKGGIQLEMLLCS